MLVHGHHHRLTPKTGEGHIQGIGQPVLGMAVEPGLRQYPPYARLKLVAKPSYFRHPGNEAGHHLGRLAEPYDPYGVLGTRPEARLVLPAAYEAFQLYVL